MQTKQELAIAVAEALSSNLVAIKSINASLQDLIGQYFNEDLSDIWAAMQTAPMNADGTLGASDGSPNVAHPIELIGRSKNTLVNAVTFAQQLNALINNQAVTQGNYLQSINDMV